MAYVPKDMSGSLFKNDRKERETHPDYKGSALLNGIDYWVSAWIKEGQKGKFLSLAFKPKQEQPAYQRPTTQAPGPASDLDPDWKDGESDDLPF